jgi:outer membrane receptor protein involved in Fe transport
LSQNTKLWTGLITNLIAGKEFLIGTNKSNAIITDIKFVLAGGNRLTPIDFEQSEQLRTTVYVLDKRYSEKAKDYFKINFKLGYRKNKKHSSYHIFLDIQNITNRKNVFLQYYDPKSAKVETFYQLGLLPILNFRIQF